MFAGLTLVRGPAAEPITIADAKAHSRIFTNVDDSLIAGYISSARHAAENTLKRAILTQQWRYALQHWPGRNYRGYQNINGVKDYYRFNHIKIPLPPLVSIDAFTYKDTVGNVFNMTQGYSNVVGNYLLDLEHEPGRVCLPFAGIWPTTILLPTSPILITYTCGWPFLTGLVDVDENTGIVSMGSPPVGSLFDPSLAGSWITIDGNSYDVLTYLDPTHLQLVVPPGGSISNGLYTANLVPQPIRHAILFLTSHFYENRETVITGRGEVAIEIPGTVDDLLAPYRVFEYANSGE